MNRMQWFARDKSTLEQITHGERVQSYITPYDMQGTQVISVVSYAKTDLAPHLADTAAEMIVQAWPRGLVVSAYAPDLQTIIVQHYTDSRETIIKRIGSFEAGITDALDVMAELKNLRIIVVPITDPIKH